MGQSKLTVVPCRLRQAREFVHRWHRHHDPPQGGIFAVGVADEDDQLRGVAIVGRPVARTTQDGFTVEVTRVATDGCPNACSCLYQAAKRAAQAMGYRRVVTKTLATESGVSLKAAGWIQTGVSDGGSWSRPSRRRKDHHPLQAKLCWEAIDGS